MKFAAGIGLCGLLCVLACGTESEEKHTQHQKISTEVKDLPIPDSTWHYDSLNVRHADSLERFIDARKAEIRFNGAYIFSHNSYIITKGFYGLKNYHTGDTLDTNVAYQLASASKPFTSTAILMLVDQGKLELDDQVKQYLPSLPYDGITIRHLLCHRGGLGNYIYFTDGLMADTAGALLTNQGIMNILQDTVPDIYYKPDTKFDYSNTGYALLALIVEKASGQSFKDYMKSHVFDPLGMAHSFVVNKETSLPEHAALGHLWDYRAPGNDYLNGVVGDKGGYTSIYDLFLFSEAYFNGELISDSLVEMATSAQNPVKPNGTSYGFGWRLINPENDRKIVYHTGWWQGFRSYFIRYPKENKNILVLDNVKRGPFWSVRQLVGLVSDDY